MTAAIWHRVPGFDRHRELEVLATSDEFERGHCSASVYTFGYGWYAIAGAPHGDISAFVPGASCDENRVKAKTWCERICGLQPETAAAHRSESAS